jgi:hypothetical protein
MKKLALTLDTLAVETFATQQERETAPGTVHANSHVCPFSWPYTGCTGCTCEEVCLTPAC